MREEMTADEVKALHRKSVTRMSKYRNRRTCVNGIWFASKREAERFGVLSLMHLAGNIGVVHRQVRFPLMVNGVEVGGYVADFVYLDASGEQIVEDCKGYRTPLYRLKKKLVKAIYGHDILET